MKEYQTPFIEIVRFEMENVLNASGEGGYTGGKDNDVGDNTTIRPF